MPDVFEKLLRPCPFCGGEAMVFERESFHEVCCLPCTASVSETTEAKAIAAWNTRLVLGFVLAFRVLP